MFVYANGIVFDGKTSDEYGLIICEIDGSEPSETTGGQIEFLTTDSPIQNRWYKTGNANYQTLQNLLPYPIYFVSTQSKLQV